MGTGLLIVLAVLPSTSQQDTASFPNPAVRLLVERAIERRRAGDASIKDYQARLHYRLAIGFGRRRWARIPPAMVEEQIARIHWQLPNDLRVDVVGRRVRARSGDLRLSSVFDRPWFVPRGVGDSVRIFSNEFPAVGALHPLSEGGPRWYRYRLGPATTIAPAGREPVRLIRLDVRPRRSGPALIAGQIWIDSARAEVVRMTFRYVGTGLWVRVGGPQSPDSASARRFNALANRVVSIDADLSYALHEGSWMPLRQVISGKLRLPLVTDMVIPFRATTTFHDYQINTGRAIAFELPLDSSAFDTDPVLARRLRRDSIRVARRGGRPEDPDSLRSWDYAGRWPGGRYELHRPSDDSLGRYSGWGDPLALAEDPREDERLRQAEAELAALAEQLPDELTGQARHGIALERPADLFQYNRVQGASFGLGYQARIPGLEFTGIYATVRYGLSDERVTGRLTLLRDSPAGRLALSGYRDIADLDPFSPGRTLGNSLNALVAAHDDADYALAVGGGISFETAIGAGTDLVIGGRLERQTSVSRRAESEINDFLGGAGIFPPNPPVDEGTFGVVSLRAVGAGAIRWAATLDGMGGEGRTVGRVYGEVRRSVGGRPGATLRLKAGVATEPTLPQALFRLGGHATVRGFDYGVLRGPAFWAAQLDIAPVGGRVRPVLFLDAGQAARAADLFGSKALVGAGVGVSLLKGLVRFDLSYPVTPEVGHKVRFDLVLQGVR